MEPRDRVFGPITQASDDGSIKSVNVSALIRRLILFDHVYVETNLLREIPLLLQAFGYKGLLQLLDEPDLDLISDALTAGSVGQSIIAERRPMGVLPLGCFDINTIRLHEPGRQFEAALSNVESLNMKAKHKRKLIKKLEEKLMRYPTDGAAGLVDYQKQLTDRPETILPALRYTLANELGTEPDTRLQVQVSKLNFDCGFKVETNISELYGIAEEKTHKIVERALLGIAGVNLRVEQMDALKAITGFKPNEAAMINAKLNLVMESVDPSIQEDRFNRVIKIGGLPGAVDIKSGVVDVQALLKLRRQKDCRDMRQWLRSLDSSSDAEISSMFSSLHEQLARATHSPQATVARWLFTTGIGALPRYGIALGAVSGITDHFIMDKLIGKPGPVTFLSNDYRSIFNA